MKFAMILSLSASLAAAQMPDFSDLTSTEYQKRKEAYEAILKWGTENPMESLDAIILKSRESEDPEWRARAISLVEEIFSSLSKGYVGIQMGETKDGVRINQVMPETPAAKAGFEVGDVVVSVQGVALSNLEFGGATATFAEVVQSHFAGDEIELEIQKNGNLGKYKIVLAPFPKEIEQGQMGILPGGRRLQLGGRFAHPARDLETINRERFRRWWDRKMQELKRKEAP